ncbi:MAG: hypothetical protein HYR64_09420 [Fimbriimonas ginsengisoli]|uniref:Uncharacterized protein n=1 Tax=Fimbriimonas ginsengisoli TaxID=1005039 RepID=A0A931LTQ9_FIMGI|nr:hypothetical protein [Fimbriimonas ginsengisoli]
MRSPLVRIGLASTPWLRPLATALAIGLVGALVAIPLFPRQVFMGPPWGTYGMNSQHQGISRFAAAPLQVIKWSTPVDLAPPYDSGGDLLIHYAPPLITRKNTVVITLKLPPLSAGLPDRFQAEGHSGVDGSLLWTMSTNYVVPPHTWFPACAGSIVLRSSYVMPDTGGNVLFRGSADASSAPVQQLCFYGLGNYTANQAWCDANVFVSSPIVADGNGNMWFSYWVTSTSPPAGFPAIGEGGIARLNTAGVGQFVTATAAAGGDSLITQPQLNCAPAISPDGKSVYAGVRANTSYYGYLCKMSAATLAPQTWVFLKDPWTGNAARVLNESTASPTIGMDGDVYYGIFNNPYLDSHGWLSHWDKNLTSKGAVGAFGWDDTPTIVPASVIHAYSGDSRYLILSKYNQYAGFYYSNINQYSTGENKLAVLDPNTAGTVDFRTSLSVMTEVLTVLGITADDYFRSIGYPNAVREWCISTAAIDPFTRCAIVNSEDGTIYRWDFDTNTLSEKVTLAPPTGEAYTATAIGPDGTVYAINNAVLFAVGPS